MAIVVSMLGYSIVFPQYPAFRSKQLQGLATFQHVPVSRLGGREVWTKYQLQGVMEQER